MGRVSWAIGRVRSAPKVSISAGRKTNSVSSPTPQISVPLMPGGVAGKPTYVRPARGNGAPSGGVDDSAARCNAIADAQARKDCLDKLH